MAQTKEKYIWGYYFNPMSYKIRVFRVTLIKETDKFYHFVDNDMMAIGWTRGSVKNTGKVSKNSDTVATSREELLRKVEAAIEKRKKLLAGWMDALNESGNKSIEVIKKAMQNSFTDGLLATEQAMAESGNGFADRVFSADSPFNKWGSGKQSS